MKRLVFLFAMVLTLASCSLNDDDAPRYFTEALPIESVEIPEEFKLGEVYQITVNYTRPNNCYNFYDFYFNSEDNQRTIAVVDTYFEDNSCLQETMAAEASFNFEVRCSGTYVFRFWQGQDDTGSDNYYIVEVPVVE